MSLYTSRHRFAGLISSLFNLYVRMYARPQVSGAEHIPTDRAFILAANHASHADTAVIFAALPRQLRRRVVAAAAQDYFFDNGLRQHISRILFNVVPVARESRGSDPLRHVVRALRENYGVLLYPEGTRSRDGTIGPFRSGIGRLISEFPGTPVIPTLLDGTSRVLPKGRIVPRPYRVKVTFGERLYLQAHPRHRATWQIAADQVREAILQMGEGSIAPVASDSKEWSDE